MTLCPALGKQNPSIPNSEHKNFLPNNDDDSLLGRFAWINKISRSQRLPCWCCCCCCANETFPLSKGLVLHARQREGYRVQTCLPRKSFIFFLLAILPFCFVLFRGWCGFSGRETLAREDGIHALVVVNARVFAGVGVFNGMNASLWKSHPTESARGSQESRFANKLHSTQRPYPYGIGQEGDLSAVKIPTDCLPLDIRRPA